MPRLFWSLLCTLLIMSMTLGAETGTDDGFKPLFNGKDLAGWTAKPNGWKIENGELVWSPKSGYIWSEAQYGDFVLDLEYKLAKGTNSGVFIRTAKTADPVQTGIEIQVLDSFGKEVPDKHDAGAMYDCLAPSKNTVKAPGEWNHMVITCKDAQITVELNGEKVLDADLNQWTQPNANPDGTKNKFKTAYKDMARKGHIGFQDHGNPVWYRNVRLKELEK